MLTAKAAHRKDLSGKPATMTHQHYREIARIIREIQPNHQPGEPVWVRSVSQIAGLFARELEGTNPNFDCARFLAACGWPEASA